MPCQTQTSQQPQQPTAVLPQNLPQTQADWSRFLQRMNGILASIIHAQYATGVNAVPTEYAVYDGTSLPALRITGATSAFDTTQAQFGAGSLKLTATASTVTVELASSGYPITLHPNWQWIGSLFLLTSASTIAGKMSVVTAVKQYDVDISGAPGASWSRLYGDYDLTADASTSCTMLLTLTGVTVGQVFNLEGWMLEPSQGATLPSPFIMTSGPRTWTQVVGSDAVNTSISTAQSTASSASTAASAAQSTADTANTTATQAQGQANTMPVINGGFDIAPTGYGWTADAGTNPWYTDTSGDTPGVGPNCARRDGSGSAVTIAYRNNGYIACQAGQVYKAQGLVKGISSPDGSAYVYISWLNASLVEIGTQPGNQVSGNTTAGSFATGVAPAGTQYARTCIGASNHSTGAYLVDNVLCSQYPSSQDEVPDGSTYARVRSAQLSAGVVSLLGTGRNAVLNPTFAQNFSGAAANAYKSSGTVIDHWTVTGASADGIAYWGGANINVRILAGFPIAASGTTIGPTISSDLFAVKAGDTFALNVDRSGYASYGAPAGVSPYHRVYLSFLNSSGGVVSNQVYDAVYGGSIAPAVFTGTVPSGAVLCIARLNMYFVNTGAATTWTSGFIDATLNSIEYVQAANLDSEVIDGSTYARIYGSELSSGKHRIGVAGSGYRVGDQRNLPAVTFSNYGSGWNGLSLSYSATTTSATISASAATLQAGSTAISYNASSVTVSGSAGTTVPYYLYYQDPTHAGGSQTLYASTSQITALSNDGNVYLASFSVTFPASGTGSGTGSGSCPLRSAWVIRRGRHGRPQHIRAGKVRVGDWLLRSDGEWAEVTYSKPELQPCVRIVAEGFGTLGCSISAPLQTADGQVLSREALGRELVVQGGSAIVSDLRGLESQWVQHITLSNAPDDFYLVGDAKTALFAHHNIKPP